MRKKLVNSLMCAVVLSGFPIATYANEKNIGPNITVSNGQTRLSIPEKNGVEVIQSEENRVVYEVKEAAKIETSGGDMVAPIVVDSRITSINNQVVQGKTVYTADLEKATFVEEGYNKLAKPTNILDHIFGIQKVHAYTQNITTHQSQFDSTYSVELYTVVHWVSYDGGVQKNITKISGGVDFHERDIEIESSSVEVRQGGWYSSQQKWFHPGARSSWEYSTGFSKVGPGENRVVTNYTVNLIRYGDRWSAYLQNNPW